MSFCPVYIPVGVPTFHLESAQDQFSRSCALLKKIDSRFICPDSMLLSMDSLCSYLDSVQPDLIVFQNLTFANAAYMSEVLRRFSCPLQLWTLREPVIDGGRLRLNSLTGAYSAANTLHAFDNRPFSYIFGSPDEERTESAICGFVQAAETKKAMRSLRMAAVGHTPQGFGFGRALDSELMNVFGVELEAIEARELIDMAKGFSDEECADYIKKTEVSTCGFSLTPENNRLDHARLYKAYSDYVRSHKIGALASRCWPDFFTAFGTPVCTVLSLLNDEGIASACEADIYGALSMWIGMNLSDAPVFFGDPVSLDERKIPSHSGTAVQQPVLLPEKTPAQLSVFTRTGKSGLQWTLAVRPSRKLPFSASAELRLEAFASSLRREKRWINRNSLPELLSSSVQTLKAGALWKRVFWRDSSPILS